MVRRVLLHLVAICSKWHCMLWRNCFLIRFPGDGGMLVICKECGGKVRISSIDWLSSESTCLYYHCMGSALRPHLGHQSDFFLYLKPIRAGG